MENELEGIDLETINPNNDAIVLPEVSEEDDEIVEETTEINEPEIDVNDDSEKQKSLQRGVNKERQLRKAAEKKNKELEARIKALEEANQLPAKTTLEKLVEQGVDEGIAKSIAEAIDNKSNIDSSTKQELADVKFKLELTEKSKEEGFEDIAEYTDEIKDLVDKGLSLEQAYYATTYKKPSSNTKSEITRKLEAKMQNNIARKEILGNSINSNSEASNSKNVKVNATAAEKAIAAAAGMTIQEYVAIRDMDTVKQYNSYNSKKKQ